MFKEIKRDEVSGGREEEIDTGNIVATCLHFTRFTQTRKHVNYERCYLGDKVRLKEVLVCFT